MKISYKDWNPKPETLAMVSTANSIIGEYERAGYQLTLRQLYYQFVARDLIPNTERSYKNLGSMITNARMAGLVSWLAIEDRGRSCHQYWYEEDIAEPVKDLPRYLRFDRWERQEFYVEVWVEKEALSNIVSQACAPWLVPYLSCKGYLSASEAWRAGQRFQQKLDQGYQCVLIHLGDHDPSGIDMTRDNKDRMDIFTGVSGEVDVRRIALNMPQIEEYTPPPNPTKLTDSRAGSYIRNYGRTSYELDALEPAILERLISDEIQTCIDIDSWDEVGAEQAEQRAILSNVYERWEEILPIINR